MAKNIQIERFLQQGAQEMSPHKIGSLSIPPKFSELEPGCFSIPNMRFFSVPSKNGKKHIEVITAENIKFPLSLLWKQGSYGPLVNNMDLDTFLRSSALIILEVKNELKSYNFDGVTRFYRDMTVNYTVE